MIFCFDGVAALGPRQDVANLTSDGVTIRIYRRMRTEPFAGMKQPLLNHSVMGLETVLEVYKDGRRAAGYRWKLYRGDKLVQRGITDVDGVSGELAVGLPVGEAALPYRLLLAAPKGAA